MAMRMFKMSIFKRNGEALTQVIANSAQHYSPVLQIVAFGGICNSAVIFDFLNSLEKLVFD